MSYRFVVSEPFREFDGSWWFLVWGQHSVRHGPFATDEAALQEAHSTFRRWAERARRRGGWAWRRTHREWVVTLPPHVPCTGLPFAPAPISSHRR